MAKEMKKIIGLLNNILKLKYIQFPCGCTVESSSIQKCWNWKNSIGPLEESPALLFRTLLKPVYLCKQGVII